ncbi:hypothetical protein GCM10022237_08940 [Nocardioides ginsengisoli]|uniref:DUF222 domain-containing protein n=1 Tax=Nocardioides ginsengisoli TaxID=363868 RepID=A0ABW3W2I8_9ACTN
MTDSASVSRLSPKDAEDEAARFLALQLAPRIDALAEYANGQGASTVSAESPLAGDDAAADPFQVSHTAWHGIAHAVDNLQAFRRLTVSGEGDHFDVSTHPFAAYPLLRAALENASVALWLLAPEDADERLTRRFRLVLQDAAHGDDVARLMGHEPTTYERRVERVSGLIANRPSVDLAACKKRAGFRAIVPEAAEGTGTDANTASVVWRLLSGLTHGDQWASLAWAEREQVDLSADGTVFTVRMTASLANTANMARYVVALAESSTRAFEMRKAPVDSDA